MTKSNALCLTLALTIMNDEIKEAVRKRKGLVSWKPFPGMPKWQREMERMFGDFVEEKVPTPDSQKLRKKAHDI
jgi:hypothetical protein